MIATAQRTTDHGITDPYEETELFEKICRRHDGRMPVGRANSAIRSARRKQPWRRAGRPPPWQTGH